MKKTGEMTGLQLTEDIYDNRIKNGKELKEKGTKIIGYLCCHVPVELITAADLVPYRICGDMKRPPLSADEYLETITCSFARSAFDLAIRGDFDFLDGIVIPHTCDNIVKLYDVWCFHVKTPYQYFVNVPHVLNPGAIEFMEAELNQFLHSLEHLIGRRIGEDSIRDAITLHNENRLLIRNLYELRKSEPPLLSGVEATKILVASMSLPVVESSALLRQVIGEIKTREKKLDKHPNRIMIHGIQLDDAGFMKLVEGLGANVVVDDICIGTRHFWNDVEEDGNPIKALAIRYLEKVYCPRTLRPRTGTRAEEMEDRFGHILKFAKDFNVTGIIFYIVKYCDIMGFDVPDLKNYLEDAGFPVLNIEDEYSTRGFARLETRVQAFLEMIG
ncbi:MAG: 2-hydroxyacyl-CoA dehydratase [Syntrophaceae bacterium]|nr:2-hydroxyacyl-CoA dehydratase [Syntrophaceae bacterium]